MIRSGPTLNGPGEFLLLLQGSQILVISHAGKQHFKLIHVFSRFTTKQHTAAPTTHDANANSIYLSSAALIYSNYGHLEHLNSLNNEWMNCLNLRYQDLECREPGLPRCRCRSRRLILCETMGASTRTIYPK
jgi:hypothetical protein